MGNLAALIADSWAMAGKIGAPCAPAPAGRMPRRSRYCRILTLIAVKVLAARLFANAWQRMRVKCSMLGLRPANSGRSLSILCAVVGDQLLQVALDIDNIHQVAMLIEAVAL